MTADERRDDDADDAQSGAAAPSDEAAQLEAERPEPPPDEEPKAAKKKKKKGKGAEAAPKSEPLPGAGTSAGDKLREAVRAFEAGDYARVRARTRELESAADPRVREAAAELAGRVAVDPVQLVVILACAAVLVAIAYVWVF